MSTATEAAPHQTDDPKPDLLGITLAHRAMLVDLVRLTDLAKAVRDRDIICTPARARAIARYIEEGDTPFEAALKGYRQRRGVQNDADLQAADLQALTGEFKGIIKTLSGREMPQDAREQLRLCTEAVFHSWNGKRAIDYRNAAGIAHDLGTAVCIVPMVFGNMGQDSGTGVATTRNVSTGERELEGDFLVNAQGEDVVAGTRQTERIAALRDKWPTLYTEFCQICEQLERHYHDVQDIEFTVERGTLWILQTRDAKRTAQAAVRIAVEMAEAGQITREQALLRVTPAHVEFFLHPQFEPTARKKAQDSGDKLAVGLNVSPGAAVGQLVFDADTAEYWSKVDKKPVILARAETKPDDVHGILAAKGVLTSHGGRTSHAALVTRQFGKPAVVGASTLDIDLEKRQLSLGDRVLREGDFVSIDGTTGEVFAGQLATSVPDVADPFLSKLLTWADERRRLGVWANADYPRDAKRARDYGAEGIGLCRTEHMFFEPDRLLNMQRMIMARTDEERVEPLAQLLPFQRADFEGLFRAMDGLNADQREVLLLVVGQDLSYEETAKIVGCPIGTVRSRLARARRELERMLAGEVAMPVPDDGAARTVKRGVRSRVPVTEPMQLAS